MNSSVLPGVGKTMRTFSPEQLRNLREVFDVLDEDGSGVCARATARLDPAWPQTWAQQPRAHSPARGAQVITADELFAVLRKIEPTATIQAAEAMIREVDADGDRVIRFDEYAPRRASRSRCTAVRPRQCTARFGRSAPAR